MGSIQFRLFAICVACASLIFFLVFLFDGALNLFQMGLSRQAVLLWDGFISIVFFTQHSVMIRRSFCSWLTGVWPASNHRIVFTIGSGIVLAAVMITWQPSTTVLYEFHGVSRLLFRAAFFLALAGCFRSAYTLRSAASCDPFGLAAAAEPALDKRNSAQRLVVRGPYAYVRHPVYLMVILLIWSCPNLTADRLLFNVLWTFWIYIGATLEDKDMRVDFGDAYREYRKNTPMLVPSITNLLRSVRFKVKRPGVHPKVFGSAVLEDSVERRQETRP
jgi:methanethiol S-methyltransferase